MKKCRVCIYFFVFNYLFLISNFKSEKDLAK